MEELLAETITAAPQEGQMTLRYALLAQQIAGRIHYGAAVKNETTGETAQVPDLTTDQSRALSFYGRITRGLVTPVTLWEVAGDFVAEW